MNVFIGSSKEATDLVLKIAGIVEDCQLKAIRWNQRPSIFKPGTFTLETLEAMVDEEKIGASIFLYTVDDKTWYRGSELGTPRDNVVFEHGLFSGRLGRTHSIIVKKGDVKLPTDLSGVTYIDYGDKNVINAEIELRDWLNNLLKEEKASSDINQAKEQTYIKTSLPMQNGEINEVDTVLGSKMGVPIWEKEQKKYLPVKIYGNMDEAKPDIIAQAKNAQEIKILATKGEEFLGLDSSIISLAELDQYKQLKRLKMVLSSADSYWINRDILALTKYGSINEFRDELLATHNILEGVMKRIIRECDLRESGIKYYKGEPHCRYIMIDDMAYVTTYGGTPAEQTKDFPVYAVKKGFGSLYEIFKKQFNDLWNQCSECGKAIREDIDCEKNTVGFVYWHYNSKTYFALVQREDGSWVLPMGHKKNNISFEDTVIREVSDRIGLREEKLKIIKEIGCWSNTEKKQEQDLHTEDTVFLMKYELEEEIQIHADFEYTAAKWWNIEEQLPFMHYTYQQLLIRNTIKNEFNINAKI